MLVDLGRNDLGRVCEYGSVMVDELMVVETYSHVLHIVSQVSGTLREGVGAMDGCAQPYRRARSPAPPRRGRCRSSMSWSRSSAAPTAARSATSLGTGDLDTAIHIRTVVVKDGQIHVQAGGATVADAMAVFRAVEVAWEQPDWA